MLAGDYVMEEQEEMYTDKKANGKTDGTKHKSEHSVHNTHTWARHVTPERDPKINNSLRQRNAV